MIRDTTDLLSAAVAPGEREQWCRVRLDLPGVPPAAMCFAVLEDGGGRSVSNSIVLRCSAARRAQSQSQSQSQSRSRSRLEAICFVPAEAASMRVRGMGLDASRREEARLTLQPLTRWQAAARLLARDPRGFAGLFRGGWPRTREGWRLRVRQVLAVSDAASNRLGLDYATWTTLFDTWTARGADPGWPGPTVGYAVLVHDRAASAAALAATLGGIAGQFLAAPHVVVDGTGDGPRWAALADELGTDYVGILQAGEVLPGHAAPLASRHLRLDGQPEVAVVDEDALSPAGARQDPLFKPQPNRFLMLTGTLSRGLWLVRADTFRRLATQQTAWAEVLRLDLWLRRSEEAPGGFSARIPFVLTHRRPDAEAAPPAVLAGIVDTHLRRTGLPMRAETAWPLRLHRTDPVGNATDNGTVTVVIPSTLRRPHSLACITAVLRGTAYPRLDVQVAVAQAEPLDEAQREAARQIEAHPNAAVTWLRADRFNFSWVNNRVIERTAGENVLLLNDDVAPTAPDWLDWMLAYLADPAVGVVGARLLYPGGDVQHGGVIMGLAGLCDHAHRHLPGNQTGYAWRAVLPQELSAVTAACMLVRRRLLAQVGGLDEAYPSAFNDVDLALRIREAGYSVIYAPQAELIHHELQTYGSHYAGDRQPFFAAEVERMRTRWAEVCAADPFHNPNLGLEPGREWRLAFPPRIDLSE